MAHKDEANLISKIIEEKDIRPVLKQKITHRFFHDATNKEVFHWLIMRTNKYSKVPSKGMLKREFPDFEFQDVEDDDLTELIDALKTSAMYADISLALKQVGKATMQDPLAGYQKFREHASKLSLIHSNTDDVDMTKSTLDIWAEFKMVRDGGGTMGIPFPWEYVNDITLGMQRGELIGIYGRPKTMKTWLSLAIAEHTHTISKKVPVFFSGEMPVVQIMKRLAALKAKLPYSAYRSGKLSFKQLFRFKRTLEEMKKSPPFMICKVDGVGEAAITEIRAKCEEYQADIAICDGIYFWMEDETHRGFRVITRGLKKNVAESLKIPVLATTQANRASEKDRGKTTAGVAFGDSLAQDCDQLFHIIREKQHEEARELLITMPAMREAQGGTFSIHAIPAENFSQKMVFQQPEEVLEGTDEGAIL